ncbi:MAG: hypothetical protein FD153_2100 [Rhodospirillaceae bacterium]|nr:MAG: hypothetical protein FD153_2100 [Rhodospirillaceae bacterium]
MVNVSFCNRTHPSSATPAKAGIYVWLGSAACRGLATRLLHYGPLHKQG